ncbi:MAG TPA: GDSL-type esterase/lipase family protein [Chitinophagales bacterium]|nr:GDSL-type esterase/lipase family protein [Chitinophagales bacterium]HNM29400.1 GDSL-type esterase/lipase family protein [Chitinophagales bacterium]
MSNITPLRILAFLAICFVALGAVCAVFPEKGIPLGKNVTLRFPTLASIFESDTTSADISNIVSIDAGDDTTEVVAKVIDTANIKGLVQLDSGVAIVTPIQFGTKEAMDNFYASLYKTASDGSRVRVMHYGDSQIEVDRITGYLRARLQSQFGGSGPGLISVMPIADFVAVKNSWSGSWDRYTTFTNRDKRVPHRSFGPNAAFSRFMPVRDTTHALGSQHSAWLKITTNKNGGARLANYRYVKLLYGNATDPVKVELLADDVLIATDTLSVGGDHNIQEFALAAAPGNFQLNFEGRDSPDIYGLSLEGNGGVIVDNLALRGSSGNFFTGMNQSQLKGYYDQMDVRLIIMQFGGNALPYLKDEAGCIKYAQSIESQINTMKRLAPGASILFVGPADMSVKEGTTYVTHPLLEILNTELKNAAFRAGAAYYDMYAAMGGKNSMVAWVNAGIATKDYIHFSPEGARKIAILLYQAMMKEYNNYVIRESI